MSWGDVEDAMQAAVVQASGFDAASVIWSYQNHSERTQPYVRINFGGALGLGIDRIASQTDLTRPNGQEILQEVRGVREVPIDIEAFTPQFVGDLAARNIVEITRTKLQLESIRGRLRRAKLSIFDIGQVQWIPDIPNANFRGRALVTLRCYVPTMDCLEYVGYIARVRGTIFPDGWTGPSGSSGLSFDSANAT